METIYIDTLVLVNLIIDYLLLLVSGRICALTLRRVNIALGAAVGAAYSALVIFPWAVFLASMPVKIAVSCVMVYIAYGSEGRFARSCITFLAVSAAFGGAVYAVSIFGGVSPGAGLLFPASARVLLLSFAVCYCAISLVFRRSAVRAERQLLRVNARLGGREADFTALRDTGNELCDPVSGKRVCITDRSVFFSLLPPEAMEAADAEPVELFRTLSEIPSLRGRIQLIPYTSVGCGGSLLVSVSPDSVSVENEGSAPILLALSPNTLCGTGEYNALI